MASLGCRSIARQVTNGIMLSAMAPPARPLEFSYEGRPAGCFEDGIYPTVAGRYRYEPYRSLGHLEMQTALRAGSRPRCTLSVNGHVVSFAVVDCPEHGVLELTELDGGKIG